MVGKVSNLLPAKKFGFITSDNGREYFFHMSDVVSDWEDLVLSFEREGGAKIQVTFEPDKTPKGLRARSVMFFQTSDQP
jgi:cold shock CspA family protein